MSTTPMIRPPPTLKAFPRAERTKPKTPRLGGGGLRRRWIDHDADRIYEWDSRHGKVEAYDGRGRHLGEFHPDTGEMTKPADPTRRITPWALS
jgi:hypothetical protein